MDCQWKAKPRSFYAAAYGTCCDQWKDAGLATMRYLELPEQILTAVMRKHQRYLPVYVDGALAPHFVTMANGLCDDDVVRAGNESVIAPATRMRCSSGTQTLKATTWRASCPASTS